MLSRSSLLVAATAAFALSSVACTALTRPEEITISAEPVGATPKAAPQPAQVQMPQGRPGGAAQAPAAAQQGG